MRGMGSGFVGLWFATCLVGAGWPAPLTITMVGNAGVMLSDGSATLLVDLPYTSGAHGYQHYDPTALAPEGTTVSVITHEHRDHFDPALFAARESWQVIGPRSVTRGLPPSRVLHGDSVQIGAFSVVAIPTPHTDDHRSYRIRWHDQVLHVVGDTERPNHLVDSPPINVLFITPWLSCAAADDGLLNIARRSVAYHLDPSGSDRICGDVDVLTQGSTFQIDGSSGGR